MTLVDLDRLWFSLLGHLRSYNFPKPAAFDIYHNVKKNLQQKL